MGCQKESYGMIYDSSIGHAFIIGGISKSIIVMVLYSKACQKCDEVDKRVEEADKHEWRNNFEVGSKIMGDVVILKMVEDAFRDCCFIIDVIVSNNASTMRYVIKNP